MANGSERYIAYAKEAVEKTAPTGAYTKLRTTGGSGIANERTSVTSNEIRDDRQITISRLGNNQPNVAIPFEFSWESFDSIMEGALGGTWIGDYELTETVTISAAADTIILEDNSSWAEKGVAVGDYIVIRNSDSDDGVYIVDAFSTTTGTDDTITVLEADGATSPTFTGSTTDEVNVDGGAYGGRIDTTGNTLTVSATNKTVTAASTAFSAVRVGDVIYFAGFTNGGNNGYKRVTTATDTVLTFADDTFTNETATTVDVDYAQHVAMLTVGTDLATYTIEEGFTDVSEYHYSAGCKVASMSMSLQPDSVITGDVSFQGQTYSEFSATPVSGSTVSASSSEVFDSYTGSLYFGSDMQCVITGMDFTLDNGLNRRYALMQKDACGIGEGRSNVSGTVNAYFPDSTLADKFSNEEVFDVRIQLEDLNNNSYTFGWPRLKFNSDSRDVTENDVTESLGFMALGGDATLTNMYVRKQPNKPV
jgi:hypothetical protein